MIKRDWKIHKTELRAWYSMKNRCLNKKSPSQKYYFRRGIKICREWQNSFEKFFQHIGPKPEGDYSLDRINNDGNYEPGNVRWATRKQQINNRGKIRKRRKKRETFRDFLAEKIKGKSLS